MATYLIDEPPLLVFPSLAKLVGLNEAIALQQIHYWIEINRKKSANFKNGYHWTYNSYREWQEQFPFWSENTIYRIIRSLEGKSLLISDILSANPRDRRKWYRIDHAHLAELQDAPPQVGEVEDPNLRRCTSPQPEGMKTETTTETTTEKRVAHAPDPRKDDSRIVAWRESANKYPAKDSWDYIIANLPPSPDVVKLRGVISAWAARGYNPRNVTGMIEWYKNGIPGTNGKPHTAASPPAVLTTADVHAEMLRNNSPRILREHGLIP